MPPRDGRTGAVPIAELAIIESDQHHLREQADIDRRTSAAFRLETRAQLSALQLAQATTASEVARTNDLVNRIDVSTGKHELILKDISLELAEHRGGLKMIAALAVVVPVAMKIVEHFAK